MVDPTVGPWSLLTALQELSLHGRTVISDGDLRPLMDLPDLRGVLLDPRRHDRPAAKELFERTGKRWPHTRRRSRAWLPGDKPGE